MWSRRERRSKGGDSLSLRRSDGARDVQHDVAGIAPALASPPAFDLLGQISLGLPGKRRDCLASSERIQPMAGGARRHVALGCAVQEDQRRIGKAGFSLPLRPQSRVMIGNANPLGGTELLRNPAHRRVRATSVGISRELMLQISCIETCKPRDPRAVTAAAEAMAGEAGVGRPRTGATERDELASAAIVVGDAGLRAAAGSKRSHPNRRCQCRKPGHSDGTAACGVGSENWTPDVRQRGSY